jgi:hypothetical protein
MAKKIVTSQADFVEENQHGLTVYRHTCPICSKPIHAQAQVEKFMVPAKWHFWGEPGLRVKVCEGAIFDGHFFTHFAVKMPSGAVNHRIAWE